MGCNFSNDVWSSVTYSIVPSAKAACGKATVVVVVVATAATMAATPPALAWPNQPRRDEGCDAVVLDGGSVAENASAEKMDDGLVALNITQPRRIARAVCVSIVIVICYVCV